MEKQKRVRRRREVRFDPPTHREAAEWIDGTCSVCGNDVPDGPLCVCCGAQFITYVAPARIVPIPEEAA